jgi:hypothetical protein
MIQDGRAGPRWSRHRLWRLCPTWLRPDSFAPCPQHAGVRLISRRWAEKIERYRAFHLHVTVT